MVSITGSGVTVGFTIVFCIPRNPLPEKQHESINYRQETLAKVKKPLVLHPIKVNGFAVNVPA